MEGKELDGIQAILDTPKQITLTNIDEYINSYLERKADRKLALQELDSVIALLHNHILSISLYLKQNYLFTHTRRFPENNDNDFLTKQELAIRYKVSIRTINSWLLDGLRCVEIGGVKRISQEAINDFVKSKRSKKFSWRSVTK